MPIDDKLGPISRALGPIGRAYHHIDDEVHRYYEKVAKKWEDEGHHRASLVSLAAMAGYVNCFVSATLLQDYPHVHNYFSLSSYYPSFGVAQSVTAHLVNKNYDGTSTSGDRKIISSGPLHLGWRLLRPSRLLALVGGCGAIIAGGVQFATGLRESDLDAIMTGAALFFAGSAYVSTASSVYLMDVDPTALDRDPAWKRALNGIREHFSPKPAPVPVPVEAQ